MASAPAVNDNRSPDADSLQGVRSAHDVPSEESPTFQAIISTAVLLRTAFRLRDEEAMVALLRNLANCVDRLEQEQDAA